jgi:hypothetical protein
VAHSRANSYGTSTGNLHSADASLANVRLGGWVPMPFRTPLLLGFGCREVFGSARVVSEVLAAFVTTPATVHGNRYDSGRLTSGL